MRNAVAFHAAVHTADRRDVLRAAIRQLERADLYFDAVAGMDLDDRDTELALVLLKRDVEALRRHIVSLRSDT